MGKEQPPLPCQLFDLIAGSGHGAIIAILLGRLRLSVEKAITAYTELVEIQLDPDPAINSQRLHERVTGVLASLQVSQSEVFRSTEFPFQSCQTLVTSVSAVNSTHPVLWRTYVARNFDNPTEELVVTLLQIAASTPDSFFPVSTKAAEYFSDILRPNPCLEVVRDAIEVFGKNAEIGLVLSLGAGHPGAIALDEVFPQRQQVHDTDQQDGDAISADICAKLQMYFAERTHEIIESTMGRRPGMYFRFNVQHGFEKVRAENYFGDLMSLTENYLKGEKISREFDAVVELLNKRRKECAPLGDNYYLTSSVATQPPPSEEKPVDDAIVLEQAELLPLPPTSRIPYSNTQLIHCIQPATRPNPQAKVAFRKLESCLLKKARHSVLHKP
ncbi:hypothetical protein FRC17_008212 [Serendipita sp. 399]|nr:hypothetical protein FRC17_008212 [Serendipita sp. 399]